MWTGFQLKNFKGYRDTGSQQLRPLTILMGPNGGGKSTLLKFLMMLKQSAEYTGTPAGPLITSVKNEREGYVDLGQFADYAYRGRSNAVIEMFLSWQPTRLSGESGIDIAAAAEVYAMRVELRHAAKKRVVVNRLDYCDHDGQDLVALTRDDQEYHLAIRDEWRDQELKDRSREYEPESFYRFPSALLNDLPSTTVRRLRRYSIELYTRLQNTLYVGPLRAQPERLYLVSNQRPGDLGVRGQNLDKVLYAEADSKLIARTNHWLKRLGLADSIQLARSAGDDSFRIKIQGIGQKQVVDLVDFGFGASQVLPVIVECLYAMPGSTILIEQPEIHLNAHHQLELPNFFTEIIHQKKQCIVETHSEYLLKRLGTLVARQEIKPEDVIVLYCFADNTGTHIEPITLDAAGQYSWWPTGFLAEGFEGAAEHLEELEKLSADEATVDGEVAE